MPKTKKTSKKKPLQKKLVKSVKVSKKKPIAKKVASAAPKMSKGKERDIKADRLIAKGKERGFITYNDILKEFPTIEEDIMFLYELYSKFQTAGIDVLEGGGMLEKEVAEPQ